MSTMYLAFSGTDAGGMKIGDTICAAHAMRLMVENEPHDNYVLSLNPRHNLNFAFDQLVLEYNVKLVHDAWEPGDLTTLYSEFDRRRNTRMLNDLKFDTYKEVYLRIHGGQRQGQLCGGEKGLGRKNIMEYYFYGQETSPKHCFGSATFGRSSLGLQWRPSAPKRSVFVAPHAVSQTNNVFTMEFWRQVIHLLLAEGVEVTVNTPNTDLFGYHDRLTYSFQPGSLRPLFEQISRQQLVLCGNTGIGWIAGAHGVPLIGGQPRFFWYQDYRYDWCGVQSLVNLFGSQSGGDEKGEGFIPADPNEPVRMVMEYLENL